ncbi:DUF6069 family protein [Micrococcaceae bacterium Sec5.7]
MNARRRGLSVAAAAALALIEWIVVVKLAGIPLTIEEMYAGASREVGWAAVIVTAVGSGLAAWLLLAVLERFTAKGPRIWVVTAVAALLLSVSGPLSAASTIGVQVALILMHVSVAAVLIAGFTDRRQPTM